MKKSFYSYTHLFCFILLFLPHLIFGQGRSKADHLDSLFKQLYTNKQFNGAVLVAEKGKPIYDKAMGYADADRHPLQLNSQFALAQVTRQFTAMAIMILQEKGKLNYSDDIRKYIPDLPYQGITIYHLLTFTSGAPDYAKLADQYWDPQKKKTATNEDVIRLLVEHKPKAMAQPGEKLVWSTTNSVLMAYLIEKVSGESYSSFLEKHIFDPLHMDNTLVYSPLKDNKRMKSQAHVFKWAMNGKDLMTDENAISGIIGDKGIYSTLVDLLKWDRSLYTEKLVREATMQQAFTPATLKDGKVATSDATRIPGLKDVGEYRYGFGWDLDTLYGNRVVFHAGFPPDGSVIYRNMDKDRTVILLTNNSTNNSHFYHFEIFDCIVRILNNQPIDFPKISIADKIGPVLVNKGVKDAISLYHHLKQTDSSVYSFNNPEELLVLGNELIEKGKADNSIGILKLNKEEFPNFPLTYFLLTRAYMMNDDYASAKKAIKKVIELVPDAKQPRQMLKMIEAKLAGKSNEN